MFLSGHACPARGKDENRMDASTLWEDLQKIRGQSPLIHNITNYVVMNTTANALLAVGASPIMSHAFEEVEEMVRLSDALVVNIGTLSPPWIDAMVRAGREANRQGIPIVLDPVGSGATILRTATAQRLIREAPPAVVRANASEIRSLVFSEQATRGVESTHTSEEALEAARSLSRQCGCVVSMSGARDLIVAETSTVKVSNGHPMMARVTGLGCTATALTAAFAAVNSSPYQAAAHAMGLMGIAGEMAAEISIGPGSLQANFLDVLYKIDKSDIERRLRISAL
jgi:hydroxyethylthiazole kinase